MDNLYWLEQIQPSDRTLVGDKAFQLSRVVQRGYPVLPGFVVSAQVLWEFLEALNGSEPLVADLPHSSLHLDVDNSRQLQRVAQRLRQEITTAPLPPDWLATLSAAVGQWETPALIFRPSVALPSGVKLGRAVPSRELTWFHASMKTSGLLEAQVCTCDQEAMALALKQTWSQLFRARSLMYWQRGGIGLQQINLAVLVQPLRNAIASGKLTYDPAKFEIQASWGLGMASSRGEVLPDSYQIQPETGAVRRTKSEPQVSRQLGNKTLAYSLVDSPKIQPLLPQPGGSCLQTYLLSEAQQQQYALKEQYLQQLIELAKQLSTDLGSTFTLEWTLSQAEESETAQLYITQVSTQVIRPEAINPLSVAGVKTPGFAHSSTPVMETAQPGAAWLLPTQHPSLSIKHSIRGLAAGAGRVVAPAHVIANSSQKPETLPPGVILVAPAIAPDWLPLLQQAAGVVTEQGGLTCHGAILARELGIPAVVSAANATHLIQTGESVLVDGDRGEIYRVSEENREKKVEKHFLTPSSMTSHRALIATQLLVNLSQPSLIERVTGLPVDGVGLLRSELMALNVLEGQHPNLWLQQGREAELVERWQEQISQFVRAFAPRPIFYRSLDWRSHEFQSFASGSSDEEAETNPMLGQRGTFSYLRNPTLFDLELTALAQVQQSGYTNLHLLLPFVRTVEEFSFCRRRVEQAGLTQVAQFQLWIMAEVPSILFLLPQYVKAGVQGVSIGTNDLTQLLLGVDRNQGQLAAAFDERHPAVMQAIAQIIQLARQAGIPCSICGQAPALYPELIDPLVRWGITSISVEPEAVELTYAAISRAEHRLILEAARNQLGQ